MEDDAFRLRTRSLAPERRASNAPQSDHTRDPAGEEFLFHLFRGSELLQDSRVHEAKEELEQALLLQPRDPKGQDLLAVVYFRIGHYPRAIQIYEQLKRDNPDSPSLRLNLALCYLKTGQAQLAREELEEVVRVQPDHRRAWGYLGLAYERLTDYDKAELAFERGGHGAMARRMAQRRRRPSLFAGAPSTNLPSVLAPAVDGTHVRPTEGMTHEEESRVGEARAAAAEAFQELDSGELSFALARPATQHPNGEASLAPDASGAPSGVERWHTVEIGEAVKTERPPASTRGATLAAPSNPPPQPAGPSRPPPEAGSPPVSAASPMSTATVQSLGSVAASVMSSVRPVTSIHPPSDSDDVPSTAALIAALASSPRDDERPLSLDRAGLLTLRLKTGAGTHDFAVRFDGLKSYTGTLAASVLERRGRSGPNGETFGGVAGAVMPVGGDGAVVVSPRPGRRRRPASCAPVRSCSYGKTPSWPSISR